MNRHENRPHPEDAEFLLLQEAETLIWDLLDERLDDEALGRLPYAPAGNERVDPHSHYIGSVFNSTSTCRNTLGDKSLEEAAGDREAVDARNTCCPASRGIPGFLASRRLIQ